MWHRMILLKNVTCHTMFDKNKCMGKKNDVLHEQTLSGMLNAMEWVPN